jgi:glutaredoxin
MKIVVYTKFSCPNCISAKQLLKSKNLDYKEINLDNEAERAAFTVMFPDVRQMPQIFIDGQRVGGLAGLQAALSQVGK